MYKYNVNLRRLRVFWLACLCLMPATWGWGTPVQQRAIWMWEEDSYALLENPQQAAQALHFLQSKGIQTLYLYADAHNDRLLLRSHPERYARLIQQMHKGGVRVHALLGSWPLHTERYVLPEHRTEALAMLQRVIDYNLAAEPQARFDGVNLDIEPHVLDAWSAQRETLLQGFVELSEAFMALKRRASVALQIGPAIPFWFDGITIRHDNRNRPASEFLQDIYDHVVLMDYRNRAEGPDGIISHASEELDYGRKIGKPVLIGIEISPNELKKITFHHLREADLERELGITQRVLGNDSAFGGFVLHHYGSYRPWTGNKK
jgi:hypothetical protein